MESRSSSIDRPVHIPLISWFFGLGLIAALVAIFIFNVSINTVAYYGIISFMLGSPLFFRVHGHCGHQHNATPNAAGPNDNDSARRSGACH